MVSDKHHLQLNSLSQVSIWFYRVWALIKITVRQNDTLGDLGRLAKQCPTMTLKGNFFFLYFKFCIVFLIVGTPFMAELMCGWTWLLVVNLPQLLPSGIRCCLWLPRSRNNLTRYQPQTTDVVSQVLSRMTVSRYSQSYKLFPYFIYWTTDTMCINTFLKFFFFFSKNAPNWRLHQSVCSAV